MRLLVREQDVPFEALAVIDHHVDHIARLDANFAIRALELLDGNQAFGFVAEVYDDFFGVDFEDGPLQDLAFRRGSEMAVVLEKVLVIFFAGQKLRVPVSPD